MTLFSFSKSLHSPPPNPTPPPPTVCFSFCFRLFLFPYEGLPPTVSPSLFSEYYTRTAGLPLVHADVYYSFATLPRAVMLRAPLPQPNLSSFEAGLNFAGLRFPGLVFPSIGASLLVGCGVPPHVTRLAFGNFLCLFFSPPFLLPLHSPPMSLCKEALQTVVLFPIILLLFSSLLFLSHPTLIFALYNRDTIFPLEYWTTVFFTSPPSLFRSNALPSFPRFLKKNPP